MAAKKSGGTGNSQKLTKATKADGRVAMREIDKIKGAARKRERGILTTDNADFADETNETNCTAET
jgi:hypothetical protein